MARTGWSVLETCLGMTTPSAPQRWLRNIFLMAQSPLLFQEGKSLPPLLSREAPTRNGVKSKTSMLLTKSSEKCPDSRPHAHAWMRSARQFGEVILALAIISLAVASVFGLTLRAQEPRSVWDGVYTKDQAKRGGAFYLQECSNCHGQELQGADMTPALTGLAFTANWDGLTLGDLFERIRITMPADRPGSLARQEIADILAYLLIVNKFPDGETELPREVQALKQILFQANKQ